jgi:hypothetical protein
VFPIQQDRKAMFFWRYNLLFGMAWHDMAYAGYGTNVMTFSFYEHAFRKSKLASERAFHNAGVYHQIKM